MARGFQVSDEDIDAKTKQIQQSMNRGNFGDLSYLNFEVGDYTLRFLPPGPDTERCFIPDIKDNLFAFPVWQHKRIPAGEGGIERARCVKNTYPNNGVDCPICDAVAEYKHWAEKAGLDEKEIAAHGMGGRNGHYNHGQAFANVINRDDESTKTYSYKGKDVEGPVIQIAAMHLKKLYNPLAMFLRNRDKFGIFFDADAGSDVFIQVTKATGSWGGFNYQCNLLRESSMYEDKRKSDDENSFIIDALLENMVDLSQIFAFPQKTAWDNIVTAGNQIRSKIGRPPNPADVDDSHAPSSHAPTEVDDAVVSARTAISGSKAPPACFKHHTEARAKCGICAWETECREETERLKPSDADKEAWYAKMEEDPSLRFSAD